MRPALHHHEDSPSLMILTFLLVLLTHLQRPLDLLDRQIHLDYHQDCPPAPPHAGGRGRARAENVTRERSRLRSQSPEPQLKPIPMSDDDDDQSPQDGRQRQRSRSRDRAHPYAQAPQTPPVPPIQPMVIQEPATEPDEDPGSSGRQHRSRSRERAPVHVSPSADEESAAVEPQSRVSDRSRSPQRMERPQRQKGKKTTAEVEKPSDLPKAKKHKPMDSDEDDELPPNEPCLQTLILQYLCYLSNQVPEEEIQRVDRSDQLPVHKVHRPVPTRPVPKEHRTVPPLRMNPLTTMTSTEKEYLAQQYKVHGVMTQEGQSSTQTFIF